MQCERIIEIYGPYILRLIGRENNPRAVCKTIDLCTLTGETHVLGGHKCTFGPTYWCHTTSHADACNVSIEKSCSCDLQFDLYYHPYCPHE